MGDKIKEFVDEWTANKPVAGSIKYTQALETLKIFEGRITRLKDEHERVRKAKAALDLEQHAEDDRLQPIEEEMQDLKSIFYLLVEDCFFINLISQAFGPNFPTHGLRLMHSRRPLGVLLYHARYFIISTNNMKYFY